MTDFIALSVLAAAVYILVAIALEPRKHWRETSSRPRGLPSLLERHVRWFQVAGAVLGGFLASSLTAVAFITVFGAWLGFTLPSLVLEYRATGARARFEHDACDATRTVTDALAAGISLRDALAEVARDLASPFAAVISGTVRRIDGGQAPAGAVYDASLRHQNSGLRAWAECIRLAERYGARLDRTFGHLTDMLKSRARSNDLLDKHTRGARRQTRMLTAAGPLFVVIFAGTMPEARAFYTSGRGTVVLVICGTVMLVARNWAKRMHHTRMSGK